MNHPINSEIKLIKEKVSDCSTPAEAFAALEGRDLICAAYEIRTKFGLTHKELSRIGVELGYFVP